MPIRKFYGESSNHKIHFLYTTKPTRSPKAGERALGQFILPPFQRASVWTEEQKRSLIESIYLGLPIGSIVWNRTMLNEETDEWLLDGQQRVTAILDYMDNKISVNGWFHKDLPHNEKVHFERMNIPVIMTEIKSVEECMDIYRRLAYGGTNHTPEDFPGLEM